MKCPASRSGTCLKSVSASVGDHPACTAGCDMARPERFQLVWPWWLEVRVKYAASTRAMSTAAWLREAALEKLERDNIS